MCAAIVIKSQSKNKLSLQTAHIDVYRFICSAWPCAVQMILAAFAHRFFFARSTQRSHRNIAEYFLSQWPYFVVVIVVFIVTVTV